MCEIFHRKFPDNFAALVPTTIFDTEDGSGGSGQDSTEKLMQTFFKVPVMCPTHSLRSPDATQEIFVQVNSMEMRQGGHFYHLLPM